MDERWVYYVGKNSKTYTLVEVHIPLPFLYEYSYNLAAV